MITLLHRWFVFLGDTIERADSEKNDRLWWGSVILGLITMLSIVALLWAVVVLIVEFISIYVVLFAVLAAFIWVIYPVFKKENR